MLGHSLGPHSCFQPLTLIAGPALTPGPEAGMNHIQTMWTMNG